MDTLLQDLAQARARKRLRGRPFVTLAYAQSVDGSIAIARGLRSALSGPESLRFTHALRARHDGILVGVGTVLADDPELRVRLVDGRDPQPVIVDSHLSTPVEAKLLSQSGRRPWIGTTSGNGQRADRSGAPHDDGATPEIDRRAPIEARGARLFVSEPQANGWVDLAALLRQLHAAGIEHLMVEGGARIITSFLDARLVDYVAVTIAPTFMGGLSAVGELGRASATRRTRPGGGAGAPRPRAQPLDQRTSRRRPGDVGRDRLAGGVSRPRTSRDPPPRPALHRSPPHRNPRGAARAAAARTGAGGHPGLGAERGHRAAGVPRRPAAGSARRRDAGRARRRDVPLSVPLRLCVGRHGGRDRRRRRAARGSGGACSRSSRTRARSSRRWPISSAVPDGLPSERAVLYPHMETAVNLILDGEPAYDDAVLVDRPGRDRPAGDRAARAVPAVGAGRRRADAGARARWRGGWARARSVGGAEEWAALAGARGADLVYELSGDPSALDLAIAAAGHEARVVVGSWYGAKRAPIDLGGRFHRRRLRIVSSQVSHIGAALSARWDRARRREATWRALADIDTAPLVSHRFAVRRRGARLCAGRRRRSRRAADLADRRARDVKERSMSDPDSRLHRRHPARFRRAALPDRRRLGTREPAALAPLSVRGDLRGPALDRHGYLLDIAEVEPRLDGIVERYRDRMLNDLPEFAGENPSLERFARIIADRIVTDLPAGSVDAITLKLWESETAFASYRRAASARGAEAARATAPAPIPMRIALVDLRPTGSDLGRLHLRPRAGGGARRARASGRRGLAALARLRARGRGQRDRGRPARGRIATARSRTTSSSKTS